ncbi:MAG: DNA/RNA helicase domain-containing protein [Bacteroidota bacterium]
MNQLQIDIDVSEYNFDREGLIEIAFNKWIRNEYPLVYFIKNDKSQKAYVGESTNGLKRIKDHLSNSKRVVLNKVSIIASDQFNKSATLDIESKLLQYLFAEGTYELQNSNGGHTRHNYFQQQLYGNSFEKIWGKLSEKNIITKTLKDIENSALFKYSPYKSLNRDQFDSVLEILNQINLKQLGSIFVNGTAGTGKTILAVYLMKLIVSPIPNTFEIESEDAKREFSAVKTFRELFPNPKIGLVISIASLRKTLKNVFHETPGLKKSMVLKPSETFKQHYDILFIDEAHRLKQRKSISWPEMGSFTKNNAKLGLGNEGTELDWVIANSKHQVFFYDSNQTVKPSDISKERFDTLLDRSSKLTLKSQMRVLGGNNYLTFLDYLMDGRESDISPIKIDPDYEFLFFNSFKDMYKQLHKRETEFKLCRCIAGYSWYWASQKDSSAMDIEIEGISLQWNQDPIDWINSKTSINEIGCIHTVQGYDLNYAGVIFGKEITWNPVTQEIEILKENYFDTNGKKGVKDPNELKQFIVNIYKSMMSRGIRGTFVYACDPQMRAYLKAHLPNYRANFPFRIIQQEHVKPFVNAVPVYDLRAAAGNFSPQQQPENFIWIELPSNISARSGYFVCQIIGESMNNIIPNGSWCLFEQDGGGSREGKTVLVQHYSIQDSDMGSGYTIKKYHSEKQVTEEGWKHERIVLQTDSSIAFDEIVLEGDELEVLKVVGLFRMVLE